MIRFASTYSTYVDNIVDRALDLPPLRKIRSTLTENSYCSWLLFKGKFDHAENKNMRKDQLLLAGQWAAQRRIEKPSCFQVVLQTVVFFSIDHIYFVFIFAEEETHFLIRCIRIKCTVYTWHTRGHKCTRTNVD